MWAPFFLAIHLAAVGLAQEIQPQPLPQGVADTGINVLYDSSHQFTFFNHWQCQRALRDAGHRVTGNQASLHRALTPGTPLRVRDQRNHAWNTFRPFVMLPAPRFHVVYTYQHGAYQPYLPEERVGLRNFVEAGGGLVIEVSQPKTPLAELATEYGAELLSEPANVFKRGAEPLPGLADEVLSAPLRIAQFSHEWTIYLAADGDKGALAWRLMGSGMVVCLTEPRLLHVKAEGREDPNGELLSWLVTKAAQGPKETPDGRCVPWEYAGIGGAIFPENEMGIGAVRVLYADNQLPDIIELAKTRFPEVMDLLQKMLPTPPNPGELFYINLAAGAGGGWAENAYTPKLVGTIAIAHESILSVLAHELAHTMNGPEATDGTPGCRLPKWWSEAHAGWFQRKVGRELGFDNELTYYPRALAQQDPLLNELDLANVPDDKMGLAWAKIWLLWSILDARYGADWYPRWMAHIHKKYNDPNRVLSMDEYISTVSETVGEDVSALFDRFGTTVKMRTNLPSIAPR
ncbi:MAG: hypothetical protein ACUVX8_04070 [Candidatus Zipacnadales bacterium]